MLSASVVNAEVVCFWKAPRTGQDRLYALSPRGSKTRNIDVLEMWMLLSHYGMSVPDANSYQNLEAAIYASYCLSQQCNVMVGTIDLLVQFGRGQKLSKI